jgi:hypothetical protein
MHFHTHLVSVIADSDFFEASSMRDEVWTLSFADHTTTCAVRHDTAEDSWDVLIYVDGELVMERRYADESNARERAQVSKHDYTRSGWTET